MYIYIGGAPWPPKTPPVNHILSPRTNIGPLSPFFKMTPKDKLSHELELTATKHTVKKLHYTIST